MRVMSCVGVRLCSGKRHICTGKHTQKGQRRILPRINPERRFHIGESHTSDRISVLIALRNFYNRFGQMTGRAQDGRVAFRILQWHQAALRRFGPLCHPVI